MAWIYTLFTVGCVSGSHWCRHQWPGRHAGCDGERLRIGSVLFSRTTSTRARPLVLHPHVQVSQVLFLQELCVHALPLLVRVLLRILRSGVCVTQYYSNQACLYVHGCTWEENTSHFSVHQKWNRSTIMQQISSKANSEFLCKVHSQWCGLLTAYLPGTAVWSW